MEAIWALFVVFDEMQRELIFCLLEVVVFEYDFFGCPVLA